MKGFFQEEELSQKQEAAQDRPVDYWHIVQKPGLWWRTVFTF